MERVVLNIDTIGEAASIKKVDAKALDLQNHADNWFPDAWCA
jgi:hypothetical protein